jgi:hypothetical protein
MPDWQERITVETEPALRVEHELRYRLAGPAIAQARTWCDLGCGNGVAAAGALGERLPEHAVLVDRERAVVETACDTLRGRADLEPVVADLTEPDDLARLRGTLLEHPVERVITCFEVMEHLRTFVPLTELLVELAESGEATVLLSVPNDAFWSVENPHHQTMWSEGAFEELRRLLPEEHVFARQTSLQGSAIVTGDDDADYDVTAHVPAGGLVPTHFLAAFGPRRLDVLAGAAVTTVDLHEQRRWVRQREADVLLVEMFVREREEWRRYIGELEDRLGGRRSGIAPPA